MKGNNFSIRPFNVLDQLEVIWPHHIVWKCNLWWPPYHVLFYISNERYWPSTRPFNDTYFWGWL